MASSTTVTKQDVIKAIKEELANESMASEAINAYFETTPWLDYTDNAVAKLGVKHEVIEDNLEGEGGPALQNSVAKFTLPTGEEFYLRITLTWISWDGFDYTDVDETLVEVYPHTQMVTFYNTTPQD